MNVNQSILIADIVSRIPAMAKDCAINNEELLKNLFELHRQPLGRRWINPGAGCRYDVEMVKWEFKYHNRDTKDIRTGKVFLEKGLKPDGKIAAVYGSIMDPENYGVTDLVEYSLEEP